MIHYRGCWINESIFSKPNSSLRGEVGLDPKNAPDFGINANDLSAIFITITRWLPAPFDDADALRSGYVVDSAQRARSLQRAMPMRMR
jgi:hypothetical protein